MGFIRTCSSLVAVVLLSTAFAAPQAAQPPKRDLRFEVSTEKHAPFGQPVTNVVPPRYVAVIELPKPVEWLAGVNYLNLKNGIFHTPVGKSVSREQQEYDNRVSFLQFIPPANYKKPENNPHVSAPVARIEIWSPTEDDARKMAESFLQVADEEAMKRRADTQAALKRAREWLAAAEKDLPELEPRLKAAKGERESMEKVIAYSGTEDATRDILELDKSLRAADIDLTVIRAKQKALENLWNRYPVGQELTNQMLAAQDVEMAGALARKSALEAERKKAVHYRDLVRQIEKDSKRLDELTKFYRMEEGKGITSIVTQQKRIAELERDLEDIHPLTVAGDKITIYRVARETTASQP